MSFIVKLLNLFITIAIHVVCFLIFIGWSISSDMANTVYYIRVFCSWKIEQLKILFTPFLSNNFFDRLIPMLFLQRSKIILKAVALHSMGSCRQQNIIVERCIIAKALLARHPRCRHPGSSCSCRVYAPRA